MGCFQKYELLEPVPGEGPKSFRARQTATGKEVVVHLMVGGRTPQNDAMLARLRALPPQSFSKLLEVGDNDGTPFVVIAAPPFQNLHDWLVAQERPAPTVTAPSPVSAPRTATPPPGKEPGEFTRLFQASQGPGSTGSAPAAAPLSAAATSQAPGQQPGEFTKLFQA